MCAAVEAMHDDPDAAVNDAGEASGMVTALFEAAQLFRDDGLQREFEPTAAHRAMPGLREQRKKRQFCDVVFRATDGAEIWAHRFVMYARYSGCYALFTEARQNLTPEQKNDLRTPPIQALVRDLEGDMVQLLVDFAYHVPLAERIGQHNVVKVLDLAEMLKLHWIRNHCLKTLKENLEPESCIGTNRLACSLGYEKLASEAYRYLLRNFNEVWKHSADFEKLTPEQMRTILEDNGLCTPNEVEDVFNAIIRWISADSAERKGYLAKFLPLLRFVRCTDTEFDRVVTHPQVHGDGDSLEVLAVIHKTLTRRWMAVGEVAGVDLSPRLWLVPRLPKDILFLFGGRITDVGYTNNMLTYNNRAHKWRPIDNPLPRARSPLGAAVIGKRIYIVGGYSRYTRYDSVWCFDVTLATWSAKASMAYKRSWHSVVALKASTGDDKALSRDCTTAKH
ncbi:hypothetical protein HPB50_017548 [Hyalomma asiaticum]|uniref:Uncharacterized protein n=1 Tax=Hyalomma asiaticum TaxID=266040 RepID=A0ACB7RUS3_HYAAI|nr:hypothetical protein HPB50_017548 [Hyalomma asiaticum]